LANNFLRARRARDVHTHEAIADGFLVQPSSWAYRGDVEAMKAVRQQKILEATKKRDERVHGNRLGPSASIVAALGLGGEPRKPNWL